MQSKVVCIVGLGLIGGSMAIALKESGFASKIFGVDSSGPNCNKAMELKLVNGTCSLEQGVAASDVVLLCTPVDSICKLLPMVLDLAGSMASRPNGCPVIADMGSTKYRIVQSVEGHPRRSSFVAVHPIAGTEHSGPEAALPHLFDGKNAILCNIAQSDPGAVATVEEMLETIGMKVSHMDAQSHDLHVAYVSHLSHLTSFSLALSVLDKEKMEGNILTLAAGGFDSTVRLAKSRGETWAPIFLQNREFVLEAIDSYIKSMMLFRNALDIGDIDRLHNLMGSANDIKKVLDR